MLRETLSDFLRKHSEEEAIRYLILFVNKAFVNKAFESVSVSGWEENDCISAYMPIKDYTFSSNMRTFTSTICALCGFVKKSLV